MKLTVEQLADLAVGAGFLGTGGGGNPYVGRMMVQRCLQEGLEVEIIDPAELADDAFVIPTAMMGAPSVLVEKIPNGNECITAFQRLERHLGRKATATMPIEIGGINSTIPLLVGARLGLPIIDADGMGRAFPFLEMETFGVYGIPGSPMVVSNEWGECTLIEARDNRRMEWFSRAIAIRMGGCAYIAEYAMTGADVKRTAIPNTLTLAIRIGELLRKARESHVNPIEALLNYLPSTLYKYGRVIFQGKIVDMMRETKAGFVMGRAKIDGIAPFSSQMEIEIQNENLVARVEGKVKAIVPDLICIMNTETAEPITTEELRYGQRVTVVAVSVPEIMRTPEALDVFGPACFGLKEPFISIEEIA
jgi:uncharacterized protein